MLLNSWSSLKCNPRIFSVPFVKNRYGSAIVCGSGPSLDNSLEAIKKLSENSLIISCASNYGTLRKAGIEVDILCLLERGDFMLEQYQSVVDQFGSGKTRLLASVTTPAGLQDLFHEPMVYFRPALTPLSIFADSPDQVLTNEGPQTINTGVALALAIGARQVILFGVDLGSVDSYSQRSADAIGESPRTFDREVEANFGGKAFTNDLLLDGQLVLQELAKHHRNTDTMLLNASNGIMIDGWVPTQPSDLCSDAYNLDKFNRNKLDEWWTSRRSFDSMHFHALWRSSRPREMINNTITSLINVFGTIYPWYPNTLIAAHELLKLSQGSISAQLAPRLLRGQIEKLMIAAQRQMIIMASESDKCDKFEKQARTIMINRLNSLRKEIFELFDLLESSLS